MKNCKTFYKAQTAIRRKEIIQPLRTPQSHQIKSCCFSGTKFFLRRYTEIYRQTFAFKVLLSWATTNAVQVFFLTPNKNMFAGKFVNEKDFWLCCGSILVLMSIELRLVKQVRFFDRKYIVKWVIYLTSFCWFLDYLLENLKWKETPLQRVDNY